MTLPHLQRTGYGKFLIDFSYNLSKIEKKPGTPERPLSDLGHRSYVSYWTSRVLNILLRCNEQQTTISIQNIAEETGILPADIQYVLESYEILRCHNGRFFMFTEEKHLKMILATKGGNPKYEKRVKPDLIHWVPNSN